MYNTVNEMHIALDLAIQEINSNRQQSISVDHKDMALNYAVLQFIETRSNPKTNIKQEGLEETTKRYDDLRELKRTYEANTYDHGDNKVIAPLPSDYYKYMEFGCDVTYSKFKKFDKEHKNLNYHVLPFEDSKSGDKHYEGLNINGDSKTLFDISEYSGMPDLYRSDAKFMAINLILEELNKMDDIDVYWEYYLDKYYKQSFIIVDNVGKQKYTSYSITYVTATTKSVPVMSKDKKESIYIYKSPASIKERPLDIYSSDFTFSANSNTYHNRNRHTNPMGEIKDSRVVVHEGDNFIVSKIKLNYIKKPRPISYRHNQMCELSINREIIDLAVKKLQAYLKDEGYQYTANESQVIE